MASTRLPRFKRSPNVPSIRLTERDREILRHIHRHRFLRSDHLTSLLPGSRQQVLRRLRLLYHHGFLERPRCQIDYYHRGGSRSMVYGIGNKGAGLLKRELLVPYHRIDWPSKNKIQRLFLEHALLVSDVMVAAELACRNRADVRLLAPEHVGREPFQWRVEIGRGRVCGVIPDRVFGLEFAGRRKGLNEIWFCLEVDRGTMPVTRASLDQSSIYRKFLAYEATWKQNLHRSSLGWARFRVIVVTNNPERVATMRQVACSLEHGRGLFLFAVHDALKQSNNLLSFPWASFCEGRTASLLD
jgi:hypothetical protein